MAQAPKQQNLDKKAQQHPQSNRDRPITERLLQEEATDYNLAELARQRSRYTDFPGARDIQANLEQILQRWGLTEAELCERSRAIHATTQRYKVSSNKREDWN